MDASRGLLTELQAGSFLLMDVAYRNPGVPFENALFCRSTVISRPTPERAVCDAGQKTLTADSGPAEVTGRPGVRYLRGSTVSVTGQAFYCSADGEVYGPERTRTWRVEPGAYRMLLPA